MNLFDRLFRPHRRPNRAEAGFEIQPNDPAEFHALATRAKYPRRRGRSPEEFAADLAAYHAELRAKFAASFELQRRRALAIGSTHFTWRTAGDSDVCRSCRARAGKRLPWPARPGTDACEGCSGDYCRCYAETVPPRI